MSYYLILFPPLNSFLQWIVSAHSCTVTFGFPNSKKNSFSGNYMRKYGICILKLGWKFEIEAWGNRLSVWMKLFKWDQYFLKFEWSSIDFYFQILLIFCKTNVTIFSRSFWTISLGIQSWSLSSDKFIPLAADSSFAIKNKSE